MHLHQLPLLLDVAGILRFSELIRAVVVRALALDVVAPGVCVPKDTRPALECHGQGSLAITR